MGHPFSNQGKQTIDRTGPRGAEEVSGLRIFVFSSLAVLCSLRKRVALAEELLVTDDGLPCPTVGAWAETKYRLVGLYDTLFSSGIKNKWGRRIYVDLYAGAGYAHIRNTSRVVQSSALIALGVKDRFDKYVFCEESEEWLEALRARVQRIAPDADAAYILGDCNATVDRILDEIPRGVSGDTVLTLCFVDPF